MDTLFYGTFGSLIIFFCGIGAIVCLNLWLAIVAIMIKWWWGIIVLFVPLGNVVFAVCHWEVAKKPFLIGILFLVLSVGMFVLRSFVAIFFLDVPAPA